MKYTLHFAEGVQQSVTIVVFVSRNPSINWTILDVTQCASPNIVTDGLLYLFPSCNTENNTLHTLLELSSLYCVTFSCNICFINLIACRLVDNCWEFSILKYLHENSMDSFWYYIASMFVKTFCIPHKPCIHMIFFMLYIFSIGVLISNKLTFIIL